MVEKRFIVRLINNCAMVDSIFQTLLLLAYFDIALVAITIGNYAVSASYLGRESRLSRWRMERRRQKLRVRLKELDVEKAEIKSIKKEIEEAESDEEVLSRNIFILSWQGAVVLPSLCFIVSLFCAVVGMNSEIVWSGANQPNLGQIIGVSAFLMGMGFFALFVVIRTIDCAARKLPIPEFEVSFENGAKVLKLKRNERRTVTVCADNKGEDISEDLKIFVNFPPAFIIYPSAYYEVAKQTAGTEHPDYNAAILEAEVLHIDNILLGHIDLTLPDEKKTYEIPVDIYERKTGVSKHKLTIEVVD